MQAQLDKARALEELAKQRGGNVNGTEAHKRLAINLRDQKKVEFFVKLLEEVDEDLKKALVVSQGLQSSTAETYPTDRNMVAHYDPSSSSSMPKRAIRLLPNSPESFSFVNAD